MSLQVFVEELRRWLNSEIAPTNSLAIVKRIEQLLDVAGTNSFLFAEDKVRCIAAGYILQLLLHIFPPITSKTGIPMMLTLADLVFLGERGDQDILSRIAKTVKKCLETIES